MTTVNITFTPSPRTADTFFVIRSVSEDGFSIGSLEAKEAAHSGVLTIRWDMAAKMVKALRAVVDNVRCPSLGFDTQTMEFPGNDAFSRSMRDATNAIDAMLFSADPDDQMRQTLRNYVERWARQLDAMDAHNTDEG